MKQYRLYQLHKVQISTKDKNTTVTLWERTTHSGVWTPIHTGWHLYTRVAHITPEITTWWTVSLDSIDQFILFLSPLYSRKHLVEAAHAGIHLRGGSRCSLAGEWLRLQLRGAAATSASQWPGRLEAQRLAGSMCISGDQQLGAAEAGMSPPLLVSASQILAVAAVAPRRRWRLFWLCWHSLKLVTFHYKRGSSKTMAVAVAAQVKTNLLRDLINL